ncbi:MAG: hypothetical protein ACKO23_11170, partial [Gemmataceae bacterium]
KRPGHDPLGRMETGLDGLTWTNLKEIPGQKYQGITQENHLFAERNGIGSRLDKDPFPMWEGFVIAARLKVRRERKREGKENNHAYSFCLFDARAISPRFSIFIRANQPGW